MTVTTPTLTSFAAPRGGASLPGDGPAAGSTTPTLTSFAAPRGGASLPGDGDASSRRGAPRSGDRRHVRVVARGRRSMPRQLAPAQRGRGPAAGSTTPTLTSSPRGRGPAGGWR